MADEDLKARLQDHSKAFDTLMSLIPAEQIYGKDSSDQWQRKKQTKEERRAAKMAKLAPGANKTALDVHREREEQERDRKRKREAEDDVEDPWRKKGDDGEDGPNSKRTKTEDVKEPKPKKKKHKRPTETPEEEEQVRQEKADKRKQKNREKKQKKKELNERKRERRKAKKEQSNDDKLDPIHSDVAPLTTKQKAKKQKKAKKESGPREAQAAESATSTKKAASDEEADDSSSDIDLSENDLRDAGQPVESPEDDVDDVSSSGSSPEQENLFDRSTNLSSASSSSSVVPPSNPSDGEPKQKKPQSSTSDGIDHATTVQKDEHDEDSDDDSSEVFDTKVNVDAPARKSPQSTNPEPQSQKPSVKSASNHTVQQSPTALDPTASHDGDDEVQLPKIDREALTKRLEEKLAALRAARKADGPDGKPAKNRAELIESRRRKAELRKQRKKEQRAKDRLAKDAETEAARLRGGNGSPIWSPSLYSPGGALANQQENNFQFGKIAFDDGAEVDAGTGTLKGERRKKGKSDTKTALLAAEKKRARLAGYDTDKRAEIEEKDAWAAAKNRVTGEKPKDDPSLLKKTIKRQEKAKGKSEKEWNDRLEGVRKGKEARQQKREDNLRKRKEMKGVKGKERKKLLGKKSGGGVQKPKQRKRPGFEGTFKTAARRT